MTVIKTIVERSPTAIHIVITGSDSEKEWEACRDRMTVIKTIVERSPTAIHIVITGSDSEKEWEACRTMGVAGYIAKNSLKPGTMSTILERISDHGYCVGIMHETSVAPEIYHTALSPREQEVLAWR